MNIKNFLIPLIFGVALIFGCKDKGLLLYDDGLLVYDDIEFDSSVVNCMITPESDTLYFGFHKRGDQAPEGHILGNGIYLTVERWSTAKYNRDFTIPVMQDGAPNFYAVCNLTDSTGNFMIVVKPEMITKPLYLKLIKYNHFPELSYSKQQRDTLTINFIPDQEQL